MIEKYLVSNCLLIIDEFNLKFKNDTNEEIREYANFEFDEADLVFLIGYPFRNLAKFNFNKKKDKRNDIEVRAKKYFKIEIKFFKNYRSGVSFSNSSNFEKFKDDFMWLREEIKRGQKGERAFVIGWFNIYESFGQIMKLGKSKNGKTSGPKPEVDLKKLDFFPFMNLKEGGEKTKDLVYEYSKAYEPLSIKRVGFPDENISCLFLGSQEDKFHFAIYF